MFCIYPARSVSEPVSATAARVMATLLASVHPRAKQRIREGHRQGKGKGKGHEHLRADPQQREGQGEIQGANVWNLLDMRRRAPRGELPQGQGEGLNQVGEPEVFDQWEPEEWRSPEIRTPSHIQERILDPKPEGTSKEGWTLIDFVKAPPTGRGEEGQEGESSGVEGHPHHRARDGQQRHDQEQQGSHRLRGG